MYTINEIFPFDIQYISSPSFGYMMWLFFIYFTGWITLMLDVSMIYNMCSKFKKYCKKEDTLHLELFRIPILIPTEEELNY